MPEERAEDREVAGIRCTEVLARLSDFVDGDLEPAERARIEAHLRGCGWCESFGGAFSGVVRRLREQLAAPAPTGPDVAGRLARRLGLAEDAT